MSEQVSSYRLEEEIARGGMGIVYRGVHTVFDEVVAIKAIFPELTLNPELRERFLREAKIQRRLQHPNIVQIREFLIDQGKFYIVMEFVEGETLTHRLHELGRPMLATEATDIFHQALEGLGFAHSHGVIHRDIKPSNIMLTREGVAKLTDFGIARALGSDKLTTTGTAVGTPAYMSPEQILGTNLDRRSDIYSMGITLYEVLTGRMPFERPKHADSDFSVLAAHISRPPTPPRIWAPEIPPFLEAAILRALEKRPENRFASCQEFQAALVASALLPTRRVSVPPEAEAKKAGGPAQVPKPSPYRPEPRPQPKPVPPPPPRILLGAPQKQKSSRVGIARLVAAGLVLIVVALAWVYWPRPKPAPSPLSAPQEETSAPTKPETPVPAPNVSNPPTNPPSPQPNPTQIVVQTSPNAQIYLDDSFKGKASGQGRLVIDAVEPGDYSMRVSLAGKKDYEQEVVVAAGQVALFNVTLADAEQPPPLAPVEMVRRPVAAPRAGSIKENPKDGLKYVWIPPGSFTMGCSAGDYECSEPEKPPHEVTITRGFWMGQTPVTVGAYKRYAGSIGRRIPPAPNFNSGWMNENMPIVNVTWEEAQAYCGWIGTRLPTEAEWEYAARGGSTEARYGILDDIAWYSNNSDGQTHDVAQKRANGFGLYDALGNVSEWVNDWYDENYYQGSPAQDPEGPGYGQYRVLRGGAYYLATKFVRLSYRFRVYPDVRITYIGFRCGGNAEQALPLAPVEMARRPVSAPRTGQVRDNPKDGLKYVWIAPGTFTMGCSAGDYQCLAPEKPPHQVTITKGFWMGQTPVTVGAFKRFAESTGRRIPPAPKFNTGWVNENMPIVDVSWDEAQAYCGWIGGRLPTEAEWEYAARGGSTEARYGSIDDIAWNNNNSGRQTHDVAQKRANGFGLYDMLGNVNEWVNDWYDENYYQSSPAQDPQGPGYGQFRVRRGAGYAGGSMTLRFSSRFRLNPNFRVTDLGFRCGGDVFGP